MNTGFLIFVFQVSPNQFTARRLVRKYSLPQYRWFWINYVSMSFVYNLYIKCLYGLTKLISKSILLWISYQSITLSPILFDHFLWMAIDNWQLIIVNYQLAINKCQLLSIGSICRLLGQRKELASLRSTLPHMKVTPLFLTLILSGTIIKYSSYYVIHYYTWK